MVLPVMHHRFAGMHGNAHPQRPDITPIFGKQRALGIEGGGDGIRCGGKDGLHRVANGLDVDAVMGLNGRVEQSDVTRHRGRHRLAIPFPERGTAFDIGEQEGDGPRGEIGHDPIPYV